VFVRLGEIAAVGADVVEVARKSRYLRGRPPEEMGRLIAQGAEHAGLGAVREHPSELECLVSLVGQARPGDVVALMTHQDRDLVDRWLVDGGAVRDAPEMLRAKVRLAQATAAPPVGTAGGA
jgi:cyanophycin synthetase